MNKKRYSIVRVDNGWCPLLESDELCDIAEDCFSCKIKTRYGDTKEQLISKVEQIIRRPIQKGDLELKSKGFKYGVRRLAKEIVEFLGVKE